MSHTHLLGISTDSKVAERLKKISDEFDFKVEIYKSTEDLNEKNADSISSVVSLLSALEIENPAEISGHIQVLKFASPRSYVILVVNKKISAENITFIKKSGADLIINDSDFFETSFLEYVLSQLIRGAMIPMKGQDFKVNSEVDFKVLTILPLNKKIVPVALPKDKINGSKHEKLKSAKELYISRDDIQKVQDYVKKNQELSADGISSRCRVNYLNLCKSHSDFIISLFDKSDRATFAVGKALLDKCTTIASEMLTNLSTLTDPWSIINNSTFGETGSVERSPAIASMAGLMTINLEGIATDDTIIAGLLCDIGMITLHPDILGKIRQNKMNELTKEELEKYQRHPLQSIDKCLEKKIPLNENIKSIILATHERFDKKGFPNNLNPALIPKESQILQYSEFIDQKLIIKMGNKNESTRTIQLNVLEEELNNKKILDLAITFEMKKYLSIIETTHKPN